MEELIKKAKSLGAKYQVLVEDTEYVLFLKEPSKEVFKAWYATYDSDPSSANETVIKTLIIKEVSTMEVFNDYKSLASVFRQLGEIMALKKSTLLIL
jgi:hypothetical protein